MTEKTLQIKEIVENGKTKTLVREQNPCGNTPIRKYRKYKDFAPEMGLVTPKEEPLDALSREFD